MRTAIICDDDFEGEVKYTIVDGDVSYLQGIYINCSEPENFSVPQQAEDLGLHCYDDLCDDLGNLSNDFEFISLPEFVAIVREDHNIPVIACGWSN